jgi:hypothetical protein
MQRPIDDSEKTYHAVSIALAIVLTTALLAWWRPRVPLWWLLALLAVSTWVFGLLPLLEEALKAAVEWLTTGLNYLRDLLTGWRQTAAGWLDRWFWNRFRRAEQRRN